MLAPRRRHRRQLLEQLQGRHHQHVPPAHGPLHAVRELPVVAPTQPRLSQLCLVEDISNTGVLLVGEFPLDATCLELLVQDPGCEPVRYVGDVVRRQERADGTRQFAVQFRERADQATSPAALTEHEFAR